MKASSFLRVHAVMIVVCLFLVGCSGSSANTSSGNLAAVTVTGASPTVLLGKTVQFTANQLVSSWSVNGTTGGTTSTGTISISGLYTAPAVLPVSASITISAIPVSGTSGSATVTIQSDISISLTAGATAAPLLTGSMVNLTASITSAGSPSTAVIWTVNGVMNGNAQSGTIVAGTNGAAIYTAPVTQPMAPVQIIATSVADPSKASSVSETVQGILLSATSATPGSSLILTGTFNIATPVNFTFSDGGSFSPSLSLMPQSAKQLTLVVPLYVSASGFGKGLVTITASQSSGSSTVTIGSAPGFTIGALPAAAGSTGTVTLAVLKNSYAAIAETQNLWTSVGSGSGGKVSATGITGSISDLQTRMQDLIGSVSQVATGGPGFSIGTRSGVPMQVDATTLATMDALLQAFFINSTDVQSAISSLPRSTLTMLGLSSSPRTADENLRAFAALPRSLLNPTSSEILLASALLAAVAATPVGATVALLGVIYVIDTEFFNSYMTNAAIQLFGNVSDVVAIQAAEADDQVVQTAIQADGAALSGDFAALASDLANLDSLLDPSNPSSPGSLANSNQPTEFNNAPVVPSSGSTPTLTAGGYTIPLTGQVLVNIFVNNAPSSSQYTFTTSWGDTGSLTADAYGYGFQASVTPVPTGNCYQGTITLADTHGNTVASTSGCWGLPISTTGSFRSGKVALLQERPQQAPPSASTEF